MLINSDIIICVYTNDETVVITVLKLSILAVVIFTLLCHEQLVLLITQKITDL